MVILFFASLTLVSQESLEIEGAIQIDSAKVNPPKAGTIQWDGQDFLGWDGAEWKSLTGQGVQGSVNGNKLLDLDGNIYETVTIGTQVWMAENLRSTRYRDGGRIPYIGRSEVWVQLDTREEPGYTWYNFDEDHKFPYGAMYNWYAVQTGDLCPTGWHVPSRVEWDALIDFLLGQAVAGGSLKATGTLIAQDGLWTSPNQGATNSAGFNVIPGGYLFIDFAGKDNQAFFWTSTQDDIQRSWSKSLFNTGTSVTEEENSKYGGASIRCVKD